MVCKRDRCFANPLKKLHIRFGAGKRSSIVEISVTHFFLGGKPVFGRNQGPMDQGHSSAINSGAEVGTFLLCAPMVGGQSTARLAHGSLNLPVPQ